MVAVVVISFNRIKWSLIIVFLLILVFLIFFQSKWFWRFIYPLKYKDFIYNYTLEYNLDPHLVSAMIYVESKFVPTACSHKGAVGLMQIMPDTGKWIAQQQGLNKFNTQRLYDPEINIKFGCWYLSTLKKEFNNELIVVLAAYNAGRGNVNRWLEEREEQGISIETLPFKETRDYIYKILEVYEHYKDLYTFNNHVKIYNILKNIDI